ncbi:MAG: response regulator, partial [Clostridia bacterium]|nr:response regulator [Clostridia bacterium]
LISGGLLALMVLFIIIRYVRKAYAYQIALENSRNEVENLARTKEMFMANMSHEIRTPLTAISGFTEQLLHESFDENKSRSLKIIKSSSDHLLRIIDDILDFSKLQNNKLSLEKIHFSISHLADEVHALFEEQARRNNTILSHSISQGTPGTLLGDPYRLKQIMINLVSNSIKFTKNGKVDFIVSGIIKNPDEIELVMEFNDTGIGIDESKLNMIFDDFTQAEMNTTRKYGGTGLGLSIVKKLVDLHLGTIEVKSRKNHGTKIVCRIPYLKGDEKQLHRGIFQTVSIPEEISGLKILVVDDEEYNRLLFKKILDRWKIRYLEAENGMDALELLKETRFDILFMDIRMPGIDGIKATKFIREEMKISETDMPIILISAAAINEESETYKNAGITAYLQKPFTEEMLLTTIMSVLFKNYGVNMAYPNHRVNIKPSDQNKINLENLYHISGGDEQFVKQMLISFSTTTKEGLKDIQEAISSGQWESVSNMAHKLMAPCKHLGASGLYYLLGKIEKNSRENADAGSVKSLTAKSIEEFRVVSELINDHIAKMN